MAESARLKNLGGVVRGGESYQGKQGPNLAIKCATYRRSNDGRKSHL
jgi:hypothetical protein